MKQGSFCSEEEEEEEEALKFPGGQEPSSAPELKEEDQLAEIEAEKNFSKLGFSNALHVGVDLPRWVQSVVREERKAEVIDVELLRYQNVEEDMVQLLQLVVDCTAQYHDKRSLMSELTRRIKELC